MHLKQHKLANHDLAKKRSPLLVCRIRPNLSSESRPPAPVTRTASLGVDDPLRDALSVEMRHFVHVDEVLHERRSARPRCLDVELVPDGTARARREHIGVLKQAPRISDITIAKQSLQQQCCFIADQTGSARFAGCTRQDL